jgi:hypothetical protein
MGIFDLDSSEEEPPTSLAIADQGQTLLALTNIGRAFRLPVSTLQDAPIRGRGASILSNYIW